MTETVINAIPDASRPAQPDSRLRTTSPEQAMHLCQTAFYPHRLKLLGPSNNFGFTQRVTRVGPITLADVTYETDVALSFDQPRASYHVNVPLTGWLKSRHPGREITVTPEAPTTLASPAMKAPRPQRLLTPQQSASQNESNDKVPRAVVAWRFPKTSTVLLASNAVSCRMLLESATYGGYDSDRSAATST